MFVMLRECEACGCPEERVFTDSFTGMEIGACCLGGFINELTMSPQSEGDNLNELLAERNLNEVAA